MKEKTFNDFSNGDFSNYQDFLRKDLKGMTIKYHKVELAEVNR